MKTLSKLAQSYVDRFEVAVGDLPGGTDRNVSTLRRSSIDKFKSSDFPNKRIEDWRFTNLAPLTKGFGPVPANEPNNFASKLFACDHEIVFEDGTFSPSKSKLDKLPDGIVISTLGEELGKGAVFSLPEDENRSLVALNTAFMRDGYCITVADDFVLSSPLAVRFQNSSSDEGRHIRNRLIMGKNSSLTLVEIHEGAGVYFSNPVTNISLSDGAKLDHFKYQNESVDAYHLAVTDVDIHTNAAYSNFSFSTGGKLSRNEFLSTLLGRGSDCTLNGAYLMRGNQHCDTTTVTEHRVPENKSQQIYKGVLDENAHGVFQGKIHIFEDAQKVSGDQLSKALVLSDNAQVACKPELEIYADDVKCSHGATSGELDDMALFYLQSRGIEQEQARQMLIEAFLGDVLDEINNDDVRDFLKTQAAGWLAQGNKDNE
ncbi:Fe-S cluster assembly protein SufD [Sneathiella glossodoripedis]|uniref:Fe-S cluster assembly protein SufD n=1 Tax=Sneathiella glossodoripedis TaxID=418853 RepID=UPI00046FC3FC|nr:Fe-S cluster assembly protein SufD [Sneathiella glossodoripedis]